MKYDQSKFILIVASVILLGGCTEKFIDANVPPMPPQKSLATPEVQFGHDVVFAKDATRLSLQERRRLEVFLNEADARSADSVIVSSTGQSVNSRRRVEIVRAFLTHRRLNVVQTLTKFASAPSANNTVRVSVRRHLVTLPGCPDWTKKTYNNFGNSVHSNFGCSTATNLGMMVANPRDLAHGRQPGLVDGEYGARSIEAYRKGETKPLLQDGASATNIGGSGGGESGDSSSGSGSGEGS
jgi:pilus assembly protein CpaD|tara:strand:- start:4080 stop:4799 length:720 start_codon:yes stop_codon:yes gene_type:complete